MTTFLIEAVVLCALFHLEVWLQTKKEPARIVYSYPPAVLQMDALPSHCRRGRFTIAFLQQKKLDFLQ